MAPKSEEECFELLVKELSSIPDREPPIAQNGETSPDGGQLTPVASEFAKSHEHNLGITAHMRVVVTSRAPAAGTATNVMIARTIRSAMSEIRPSSS
ncbi:acetyltransferase [Purpureocillium lavendulum]|uniref:Acetyltransferase n=1 Tax=Purpureocillium lavendulum TaxID=1247861 RepID=A0AB34G5T6_9HYPO|nr:acetyltransferase [Purpureocillium lavendulum]